MHIASALRESVNPVVWTRAVLMDLGFGGLIEKFEEYLGRGVTTALLVVLAVLVFTWAISQWLEFLVVSHLAVQQGGDTWWNQAKYIGSMTVPLLVVFLIFKISIRNKVKEYDKRLGEMNVEFEEDLKRKFEDFTKEIASRSESDLQQLEDMIAGARATIEAAKRATHDDG